MAGASQVISIVTPRTGTATTHRRSHSDATHDIRQAALHTSPYNPHHQAPLHSPSDNYSFSDDEDSEFFPEHSVKAGTLSKWTNYIHGWQSRYFVLKNGILSYFKSEGETSIGCRGAISMDKAIIQLHDFDELRLDITLNDSVWYLRAETQQERQEWFDAMELFKNESGYGSQGDLKRHGSLISLTSNRSVTSINSYMKGRGLKEKLAEMETFRDILCRQIDTLQSYFDSCADQNQPFGGDSLDDTLVDESDVNSDTTETDTVGTDDHGTLVNPLTKLPVHPSGTHAIDFRGESLTFKSTTAGILDTLQHCIDLMQQRDDAWRRRLEKEQERRRRAEELALKHSSAADERVKRVVVLGGPDFEEGPHCALNEEVWHDALDAALEKREMEDKRMQQRLQKRHSQISLIPPITTTVLLSTEHPLFPEVDSLTLEQLHYARIGVGARDGVWELFSEDGEMKMYKRELEIDGLVCDPLKAVHTVTGVTAREYCHYFYAADYKQDWDTTLEYAQTIEQPSEDTLVIHQIHKRVWPAAQRESLFWSHMRKIPEMPDSDAVDTWIVCNKDTERSDTPVKNGSIRVGLTVAMVCQTVVRNDIEVKNGSIRVGLTVAMVCQTVVRNDIEVEGQSERDRLTCKIIYVSQVNPGGWAPSSALRVIYKREYPKFLKRFTQYVQQKIEGKPPLF